MSLDDNAARYLQVTPSGAYYATVNSQPDDARAILLQLMSSEAALEFSIELFAELADMEESSAQALFDRLLARRFLGLVSEPTEPFKGSLEAGLVDILPSLSSSGKVVLGDDQGFCLASAGFEQDHADGLAALSADLIALHERHGRLLNTDLKLMGQSWGLLDPVGSSILGTWIVHIGSQSFALMIHEQPNLNQQSFVDLLSALAVRYLN